ncbi:peptidoglycan-binding protein [uncultured Jatrophihabitans sp.]|uniref:peptidoglycan-binding protein n=1 Tax=uncultured Jatrophihabitans sp. TaxID=1610747 RepID=UPI0035C9AFB4
MALPDAWARTTAFFADADAGLDTAPDAHARITADSRTDSRTDSGTGSALRTGARRGPRARRRRAGAIAAATVALGGVVAALLPAGVAAADPSASAWRRLRVCESSDNYRTNTGNGHYGAYQFDLATWRSVGGGGYPNKASKAEQDARALILYRERGWQPWQCAAILGLREDSDARSGQISDIHVGAANGGTAKGDTGNTGTSAGSTRVPAFPGGSHWYVYGETDPHIKTFQDRMHARGYFPVGTGQFGPNTLKMVKRLQRLNGLVPNGYLGPNTWRLAWTGKYSSAGTTARPIRVPAFPGGSHWYVYGETNPHIKTFQDRMHARGYFPVGTGQFGPNTLKMVKRLQRLNGLVPNGYLGPNTWRLAWTGKY